jgi:FkbM family methyltransferase
MSNLINKFIRWPLSKMGIHVCQTHKFPICDGSLLDLAVPAFLTRFTDFTVCQVGASDGKTSDPLEHLIRKYDLRGVLIEPLPKSFELLQKKYINSKNITCVNCAVSEVSGTVSFFCPKDDGHHGLSDFQKSGLTKKSMLKAGINDDAIEQITVMSKTLVDIIREQGLDRIHLLQIDTEGFDFEIVKCALNLPDLPPVIHFESIHLSKLDKLGSRELLASKGYYLIESEMDTLAYQRPLIA